MVFESVNMFGNRSLRIVEFVAIVELNSNFVIEGFFNLKLKPELRVIGFKTK
jgi:hypothetical protein